MRGFAFTVDMLYGALVVLLLFSILINTQSNSYAPQMTLLQIQAKGRVMEWFYSTPDRYVTYPPGLAGSCPSSGDKLCSCDLAFRPRVTTTFSPPNNAGSWVSQTICVVSP